MPFTRRRGGSQMMMRGDYTPYDVYLAELIAAAGVGGDWPLDEAVGSIIANNRATALAAAGAELFSNPSFDSGVTGWTEVLNGGSSSYPAGQASITAPAGNVAQLQQAVAAVGDTYDLEVDIASISAGQAAYGVATSGANLLTATTPGVKSLRTVAYATTGVLRTNSVGQTVVWNGASLKRRKQNGLDGGVAGTFTFGVAGEFAGETAADLNGSTGLFTVFNRANIQGLANLTLLAMLNPDVTGANDRIFFKSGEVDVIFNADGTVTVTINFASTNAVTTTTTTFSAGAWQQIGIQLSSADNIARVFKNGVECSYSGTPQAGVGARVSNTNNWQFGKDASTNGFDGKAQKVALVASAIGAPAIARLYRQRRFP